MLVSRNREDPKRFPTEMLLVKFSSMRSEVSAHLALEARLPEIAAADRHGAAIDLHHKASPRTVRECQTKNKIGKKTDFAQHSIVRHLHSQRKWVPGVFLR